MARYLDGLFDGGVAKGQSGSAREPREGNLDTREGSGGGIQCGPPGRSAPSTGTRSEDEDGVGVVGSVGGGVG